jgi:hypothetical protein
VPKAGAKSVIAGRTLPPAAGGHLRLAAKLSGGLEPSGPVLEGGPARLLRTTSASGTVS